MTLYGDITPMLYYLRSPQFISPQSADIREM